MEKAAYLLKNIYRMFGLAGRMFDAKGKPLAVPFSGFEEEDPVCCSTELLAALQKAGQEVPDGYGAYSDGSYWYYVFRSPKGCVIWGPVIFEEHSRYERHLYCKKHGVQGECIGIPLMDFWRAEEVIAFAHGLIFEEYERSAVFDSGRLGKKFEGELSSRRLEYALENAEWGMEHHTFADEKRAWKWLIEGEALTGNEQFFSDGVDRAFENMTGAPGVMAESQRKNAEYGVVAGITMATRYAIAAGAEEREAYALSDVMLQTLAKAKTVVEMMNISEYAFREFGRLGREAKKKSETYSRYVEQSRDYIAGHIYEKLSLQQIAENVGVHPAYLSRIFSEQTGMTMTDYIMKEKIHISCNLLKYSNRSIAVIAEYINLSPQSYFTKVFKRVTGETPAQYRRTHEDKNFMES